ncbi:uncharacterized protein H6S33_000110 [Morchella sextelata]|uniref:uncharacterized protein n=1 Tax=Morchella sextelata TaxID=1174677 RepID=UPI001D05ADE3|nr:uncharacterized protein H6S33_000110 [Morchella sextelata]KAH0614474.1 hypothetical protein H6S33_000110 [Morchella sextelata]
MGITGLYSELGPGERISLAKVASDHFEATGRRLRLAVDASIWSFQVQSGKGGTNPALRTLYYRLLRLYQLNITPLFVFDGRKRPVFKRNHKTNTQVIPSLQKNTKSYLKLFGFPYHDAPGEAEAECALLQRHGVVDAVMSEDVDTLMFGCGITFRNWSGEGKAVGERSHAEGNDTGRTDERTAVEAAKAGFGEALCNLEVDDEDGFREWRERLSFELETNKSGWFRRKNKVIKIPEDFPDKMVLGYYTNPAVSSEEAVEKLRRKIAWDGNVDLFRLRESVRYAFEWKGKGGAAAFVRTLAPAILSRRLADGEDGAELNTIVKGFHGKREHSSTGGLKELRISFIPGEVIKIDMDAEEEDEVSEQEEDEDPDEDGVRKRKDYDIFATERVWIQELFIRQSLGERIEEWETPKISNPKAPKKAPTKTKAKPKEGTASGSILKYMSISKPNDMEKSRGKKPEIRICEDLDALTFAESQRSCDASEPEEPFAERRRSRSITRKYVVEGLGLRETAESSRPKASKLQKKPTKCQREESSEGSDGDHSNLRRTYSTPSALEDAQLPLDHHSSIHILEESLPEPLYDLLCPSRSYSPPSLGPRTRPTYETITIESSPAPAPDIDDLCTNNSPPNTPTKRYRSSGITEAPPRSSTQTQEYETPEIRTPSPDRFPNIELSPPHTPTAAFGRLQVVDLVGDDEYDVGEKSIDSTLDFSPSAHLSPNITTKRKGRKVKTKDPEQQSPEMLKEKKKYILTSPVPFPIPVARRHRPTSPLRRVFSASDTAGIVTSPIETVDDPPVEVQDEIVDHASFYPPSKEVTTRTGADIVNRNSDIVTGTGISIEITQDIQVEISDDELDITTAPIAHKKTTQDQARRSVASKITCSEVATASAKLEKGPIAANGKTTKRIALRESLDGHWEFIEDDWSIREGKTLWRDVDVVDLTGDD